MSSNNMAQNYEDAIAKFVVGYNKGIILNSVTMHSLDILNDSMEQVQKGLSTIVSAFEEMRASSNSTAGNAGRIDSMMEGILSTNANMNDGISKRMEEVEDAATNAKTLAGLFGELEQKTKKVAGITGSIQDVSDRTGVLAINASIEAARAGNVGQGFRIIANEVRNLAVQTGDFAKQIESSIGEFEETVEGINRQMNEFVNLFSRFKISFGEVLQNFNDNARTINEAGESLSEITAAIQEEATALNDGLASLTSVNHSMHDTHAILEVIRSSHGYLETLLEKDTNDMGIE